MTTRNNPDPMVDYGSPVLMGQNKQYPGQDFASNNMYSGRNVHPSQENPVGPSSGNVYSAPDRNSFVQTPNTRQNQNILQSNAQAILGPSRNTYNSRENVNQLDSRRSVPQSDQSNYLPSRDIYAPREDYYQVAEPKSMNSF